MARADMVREDLILDAIQRGRHTNDLFYTHVKDGPTQERDRGELRVIDGLALRKSWARPLVTGYEVKCTRTDWLRDDKWHDYRRFSHEFYLVAPKGVVETAELPEGVGLIHYYPASQSIRLVVKARHQNAALDPQLMFYILLTRAESDRHPMFSDRRSFLEAWVADKKERQTLGRLVASVLGAKLAALQERIREQEGQVLQLTPYRDRYEKISRVLVERAGIDVRHHDWESRLANRLQKGLPPEFPEMVERATILAAMLKRAAGEGRAP